MRWKAFARRSALQVSACVLGILLCASANSQSKAASASTSNSAGARGLNAMWLRSALGVGFAAANLLVEQPSPYVVNAPYSAVGDIESITRFPDGNRIVQTASIRSYRDGQGRSRTERPVPGPDAVTVMIDDIVSGQHYILRPPAKVAYVFKMPVSKSGGTTLQPPVAAPENGAQFFRAGIDLPPGQAMSPPVSTALGEKEIEAVTATGTRWEQTFAAGIIGNDKPITVTVEQWFSPDLGVMVSASERTSTGAELTFRLHDIRRDEPDAALFTIPADYTRQESQTFGPTAIAIQKRAN